MPIGEVRLPVSEVVRLFPDAVNVDGEDHFGSYDVEVILRPVGPDMTELEFDNTQLWRVNAKAVGTSFLPRDEVEAVPIALVHRFGEMAVVYEAKECYGDTRLQMKTEDWFRNCYHYVGGVDYNV